ncbi:MAG: hypothetical protein AB1499_09490 [Nitrospirota bacterium]
MNDIKRKFPSGTVILVIDLIAYSLITVFFFHYERMTGDTTLYLSIAEKYVSGDFGNAVNGYWGPLLSWLLVPFLYAGSSHLFAVNSLHVFFGYLTIIGIWKLSFRFEMSDGIRSIVMVPLVPILVFISLIEPMDFLLLCVLVYYLDIVFREDFPDRVSHAVSGGVLGAFAYFSKPYGFPFFLSHFLLINACHYFSNPVTEQRKKVLKSVMAGLITFFLISGVWIALISKKYNHLTFSNMGKGVFASLGPESEHATLEKGDPIFFEGFFAPPNETAFVIYEDPTYARKKSWSPLESRRLFRHYVDNLIENFFESLRIFESYSRLSIAVVLIYVLLVFRQPFNRLFLSRDLLYPLLTVILFTGGYFPFHFETRYLWIVNILLLLMGGRVLHELYKQEFFRKGLIKGILTTCFILSFMVTPVKSSVDVVRNNLNSEMHDFGVELARRYDIKGNIASNRERVNSSVHDSWHRTFRLSYWLKSRYYGQAREGISDRDLENELDKFGIDYYFLWGDTDSVPEFLSQYQEVTNGEINGLKIFSLKQKQQT